MPAEIEIKKTRISGHYAPILQAPAEGWEALWAPRAPRALLRAFGSSRVAMSKPWTLKLEKIQDILSKNEGITLIFMIQRKSKLGKISIKH